MLKDRNLLCLTLSYAALGYFQYLFFYWAQYYFETVQKVPKGTSREYSTLLTLAMGAGMVFGGLLSDWAMARLGPRRGLRVAPVLGFLLSAVFGAVGMYGRSPAEVLPPECPLPRSPHRD